MPGRSRLVWLCPSLDLIIISSLIYKVGIRLFVFRLHQHRGRKYWICLESKMGLIYGVPILKSTRALCYILVKPTPQSQFISSFTVVESHSIITEKVTNA